MTLSKYLGENYIALYNSMCRRDKLLLKTTVFRALQILQKLSFI